MVKERKHINIEPEKSNNIRKNYGVTRNSWLSIKVYKKYDVASTEKKRKYNDCLLIWFGQLKKKQYEAGKRRCFG